MTLLVVPILDPFAVGIYDAEGNLIDTYYGDAKISDGLIPVLRVCIETYPIKTLLYVNGPGSHMAIKIAYVTLRTLSVLSDRPLYGCSAFDLNGGKPLKAIGQLYFVKEKETIITKKLPQPVDTAFALPACLDLASLKRDAKPDYRLPAVS